MSESKTIAVIDGNSLMHRAFHAIPPSMVAPDGTPTNAVFGFLQMLLKFIEDVRPDAVICAFDKGKPEFRIKALEQYKAQRPPTDPDLKAQFPIIEDILHAMDIPVVALPGWEGDDVLGTIAARDEKLGYHTLLVTGDKDAYQLVNDLTKVVTTKKGITDVTIYGPAEVEERYGVRPGQFRDFLGLKGDSADNIPGVPGIGDKKAATLLQSYGSIDGIYEHLDELKGALLKNLTEHKDEAFLSREVATIVTDAPLEEWSEYDLDLETVKFPDFDQATVEETFEKYHLRAPLRRVLALVGSSAEGTAYEPAASLPTWKPIIEGEAAKEALAALNAEQQLYVAKAALQQQTLFGDGVRVAIALEEGTAVLSDDDARAFVAQAARTRCLVAGDVKALLELAYPADTAKEALLSPEEVFDAAFFDLSLAGYVAASDADSYDVPALAARFLGLDVSELEEDDLLACEAHLAKMLHQPLLQALKTEDAEEVYNAIDAPLVGVLCCMERTGAALDTRRLEVLAQESTEALSKLQMKIWSLAGEEFNIDSPKQLAHILFEVIGLTPLKKNSRGYSTAAPVLKELAKAHELPELVIKYREFAKIKSTYIDALPRMRADDGRVHTHFNQMVTTTGRLSSSDPNLQNIPVRTDFGRQIRECFVPLHEGEVFMSADYSQIELRLLAHLSGDENLIAAFNSGADFHTQTAANVFQLPVEEVTPQLRSRAKAVNFGIVYGQQAFGLSQSLDIPFADAKEMIDRYFEAFPAVRAYLDDTVAKAAETGYAETIFGRRRHIPELKYKRGSQRAFGERTAMNHPMQGSAADIIKLAMQRVQQELVARGLQTSLMLQVHDELDLSVPLPEVEEVSALVREIMESAVALKVPLTVDVSLGQNWAEAH